MNHILTIEKFLKMKSLDMLQKDVYSKYEYNVSKNKI